MTHPILAVAIDAPLRRLFDYRAPASIEPARLQPGQRVWVPFGRRKAVGVIVELRQRSEVPDTRLKSALALIDEIPVLDAILLDLLRWSAEYYRHPPGEVIAAALPVALRNGADAVASAERWTLSAAAEPGMPRPSARAPPGCAGWSTTWQLTALAARRNSARCRPAGATTCANWSNAAGCCVCARASSQPARRPLPWHANRARN